jgi:enoyl-CoA hydratase/carnithine racemase
LTAGFGAATLLAVPEIAQRGSEPMSITEAAGDTTRHAGGPVLLRRDEAGVAWLTLNRPAQRNALSAELMTALQSEIDAIAGDSATKVVVITGAGSAFSAGHDLREMRANPTREYYAARFQQSSALMLSLVKLAKPVIASVRGIATAAGCQLAASCDLVVASDEARFATPGVNIGLFCSTPMVPLSRAVGRKAAMEMLLTGDFISAERAREIGLVNRVVPVAKLDQEVSTLARKVAGMSALTLAIGKEAFYRQAELPLAEAYAYASEVMTRNMLARDAEEGIDAFLEKRSPQWEDR